MDPESKGEMFKVFNIHVPASTPVVDADFTSAQDKLMILCEDGHVLMFNLNDNKVYSLVTCPSMRILCPPMDSFFLVCDQRGHVNLYDYALKQIAFNQSEVKLEMINSIEAINFVTDFLIGIRYSTLFPNVSRGVSTEFSVLTLPQDMTIATLIHEYLKTDMVTQALANLLTLDWNFDPYKAYSCLTIIFNFLMKLALNPEREAQIEATLAAFFKSKQHIDIAVEKEYRHGMHLFAKKFFYLLIRHKSLEKAFLLANDLKSRKLFQLLFKIAHENGDLKMSQICSAKIQLLNRRGNKSHERIHESQKLKSYVKPLQTVGAHDSSQTNSLEIPCSNENSHGIDVLDVGPTRRRLHPQRLAAAPLLPSRPQPHVRPRVIEDTVEQENVPPETPPEIPPELPPELPPRRYALVTDEPKTEECCAPSTDDDSILLPPSIPPKNFMPNSNTTTNNNNTSVRTSKVNRPTNGSTASTNNVRHGGDLTRDPPNPSFHDPSSSDNKPRIECIHFGIV